MMRKFTCGLLGAAAAFSANAQAQEMPADSEPQAFVFQLVAIDQNAAMEMKSPPAAQAELLDAADEEDVANETVVLEEATEESPIGATLDSLEEQGVAKRLYSKSVAARPGEIVPVDLGFVSALTGQSYEGGGNMSFEQAEETIDVSLDFPEGQIPLLGDEFSLDRKVSLPFGGTALIGEKTTQMTSMITSGTPILRDIPLIGQWFEKEIAETVDRQLLMFLSHEGAAPPDMAIEEPEAGTP